ncbi:MAG: hypothetical protein IJT36_07565 [Alphaproteobacteria bacterium]|nr:hypothetical protein [Alphaproteobacteria bacterium]
MSGVVSSDLWIITLLSEFLISFSWGEVIPKDRDNRVGCPIDDVVFSCLSTRGVSSAKLR